MNRESMLRQASETPYWDVIVIGGGVTGLWCALDASLRGFKTILVEKGDFASATSSKSTKLVHGGLRYLRQFQLGLVREALEERQILAENAPHLVKPRSFLIPYYRSYERAFYGLGMSVYDVLAGTIGGEPHRYLTPSEVLEKCPTLQTNKLRGGCLFADGQLDDARFVIELVKMCALNEGTLLNYVKVNSLIKQGSRVVGVEAQDLINDNLMEITGKVVINATGSFSDRIRKMDDSNMTPMILHSRGTHIVVDAKFLPGSTAAVLPRTRDNRLLFLVPWHGRILVGTTDVRTDRPVQEPIPTCNEIEFLLSTAKEYLSKAPRQEDILSQFTGLRPLVRKSTTATSRLSRTHKVIRSDSGLLSIIGGKFTTARKMAEDTIDCAISAGILENVSCKTKVMLFEETKVSGKGPLLHSNLPYTEDQIDHAIEHEMAVKLTDLLARRTRCILLDVQATLEIAPAVAAKLQRRLSKTDAWREEQIETFKTFARSYMPQCVE